MSPVRLLRIDLSPDAARLVTEAVTSGEFPDASAAVEAAVLGWNAQGDALLGYSLDELRRLGDEGEASGRGELTLADIQREGLNRAGVPIAEA